MPTGSTNWPGAVDNFPVTRGDSDLIGPDAVNHAAALNALEAELGTNPSGSYATVADRLAASSVFNVKDYGALGDGVTDDRAAIQACINAAVAGGSGHGGGKIVIPYGKYMVSSPGLDFTQIYGLLIEGEGGGYGPSNGTWKPALVYTGTTGSLADFGSALALTVRHVLFQYNQPTYNGDLVKCRWRAVAPSDVIQTHFQSCAFTGATGGNRAARSLLLLDKFIISTVRDCSFLGADAGIMVGDSSYVVSCLIEGCTFNFINNQPIYLNSTDCEVLTIRNCAFEPRTEGTAGALYGSGTNLCYSLVYEGNWHGDVSVGGQPWIKDINAGNNPARVTSNLFGDPGAFPSVVGITGTWEFEANGFNQSGATAFGDLGSGRNLTMITNAGPDMFTAVVPGELRAVGNINPPGDGRLYDQMQDRFSIRKYGGAPSGTALDLVASDADEMLVFGHASALAGGQRKAVIYTDGSTLWLQAPSDVNGGGGPVRSVALTAGTTPSVVVEANKHGGSTGLGFHGTAPVTKPTITGSRGGNAAVASIASALASYGLVIDSTTA